MKVTLNWIRQYVDFDGTPEALADRLTQLGLEVERMEKRSGDFENIVVGQVVTRDPHPNADRLSYCRVNDGKVERLIVCGAQNFKAGDKIPLALPGAVMPTPAGAPPFVIKVGKIRGLESQGMMCSAKELGLAEDAEGLLLLPADATVGQPFAEHLGRPGSDVVYDLEITPNRPDWNSVIGIAREISALTGCPLRWPAITLPPAAADSVQAVDKVGVSIEDPELCPRYTARVILGAKPGPSPEWLRARLSSVGLRSINNIVDVTNYVMLEVGQPLHAFDYRRIASGDAGKPSIIVRRARAGETLTTLDGQSRALSESMLLIADASQGLALAGVMGGRDSEITDQTCDILLESAYFKPQSIRATSKAAGLKSDASYRFERGGDPSICDWASRRAAQLLLEVAGGTLAVGVVDQQPAPVPSRQIVLRHRRVAEILGVEVAPETQRKFLTGLALEVLDDPSQPDQTTYRIPSFRVDLKREHDLVEEIGRLYGIENIPSTPPRGAVGSHAFDSVHDQIAESRRLWAALGFHEAQGQTLISDVAAKLAASPDSVVPLAYPLSSDMNVLRPSLLPGLLDALRHNLSRQNPDVALFEIGRVFWSAQGQTREERRCAIALTGARAPRFWSGEDRDARRDVSDLKGALEEWLDWVGLRGVGYVRRAAPGDLFIESADITLGKQTLGVLGQVSPILARKYDLRDPVFLAELNLDWILSRRTGARSFKSLPEFPGIRRDIAMLVPEATLHEAVLAAVRQAKAAHLETVELFDVFRGRNVPEGQKSLAYALTYRAADRTLTDAEVNVSHEKVVSQLQTSLQATLRV